jgi:spore maturation protein CgeB
MIKALALKGHKVTFYEPNAFDRQKHRDMDDPSWAKVVVYPATESGVAEALASAQGADIVVKASGVGVFDALLEREVLGLQTPNTLVVFWDVDAPATLERVDQNPDDPFRPLIPQYDFILTYGGGDPVVQAYKALDANHCQPIYNALDPETHHPVPTVAGFGATLSFLGNRLPDREARVHEFFFSAVAQMPEHRFILGGSGWQENAPQHDNLKVLGHVYSRDHNAFNASALAVLNINRDSMARFGFSPPTRVFEAAGAGACLIMDQWAGAEMFLEPNREVLLAADGNEVVAHLRALDRTRARRIGKAAKDRVLAEHTYRHRAEVFERLMQSPYTTRRSA